MNRVQFCIYIKILLADDCPWDHVPVGEYHEDISGEYDFDDFSSSEDFSSSSLSSNETWCNVLTPPKNLMRSSTPRDCLADDHYYSSNFDTFFLHRNDYIIIGRFLEKTENVIKMQKCKTLKGSKAVPQNCELQITEFENPAYCGELVGLPFPDFLKRNRWVAVAVNSDQTKVMEQPLVPINPKKLTKLAQKMRRVQKNPKISNLLLKVKRKYTPLSDKTIYAKPGTKLTISIKVSLKPRITQKIPGLKPMFLLEKIDTNDTPPSVTPPDPTSNPCDQAKHKLTTPFFIGSNHFCT